MKGRFALLPLLGLGALFFHPAPARADYWYHQHRYQYGWVHLDLRQRPEPHRIYYEHGVSGNDRSLDERGIGGTTKREGLSARSPYTSPELKGEKETPLTRSR